MGQGITRCTNPMSSAAWGYLMFSLAQINQTCSSDHTTWVQAVAERCGMGNGMLSWAHKGHLGELMGQPNVAVSVLIPVPKVMAAANTLLPSQVPSWDTFPGTQTTKITGFKLQTDILSQEYLRIKI